MNQLAKSDRQQAAGQMKIGVQRIAGKYPFHAKILEQFVIRCRPEVGTMGVTVVGDDVHLYYNPRFVLNIELDELGGVILHEIHHVVFDHILADPADYPDRWARTVAEEITVNEFVTEPLPGEPIRLEVFSDLPPMESTDQRYERLKGHTDRFPISSLPMVVVDDHSVWESARLVPERAAAAMRAAIQDAVLLLGPDKVPDYLRAAMRKMGIGRVPGTGSYELDGYARGKLPWVRLLRRYVGQCLVVQPDFCRPSRRFPKLAGVVPGKRRRGGRANIMAVVDTSGSITPDLLELISGELGRLAADFDVLVVECDAEIQDVYRYRPIRSVSGRGGTNLCPPLENGFLQQNRPDLVIYFTDGFGPAPENPPRVPVVWCLTPENQRPAEWGRVIEMTESEAEY